MQNPDPSPAERAATSNRAAFLHWASAVHGLRLGPEDGALRAWAQADPATAATLIRLFAGGGFSSARLAAGLLLEADLRPDDRILVLGEEPEWLAQALCATQGRAGTAAEASVLVTDRRPDALPPRLRRLILIGGVTMTVPPDIVVTRPEDWTYPRESSAD